MAMMGNTSAARAHGRIRYVCANAWSRSARSVNGCEVYRKIVTTSDAGEGGARWRGEDDGVMFSTRNIYTILIL